MFLSQSLIAQQHTHIISERSPSILFFSSVYNNPATKKFFIENSYWKISSGVENNILRKPVQKGDRTSKFLFNSQSFLQKNNSLFYGDIIYEKGKIDNVKWFESSDYELISPCVIADTLGGDMNFEEYYFKGGYSRQIHKWILGAEFYYRANYQFRNVDPRPKNIVSDYEIKLGTSYLLRDKYVIGLNLRLGFYTQDNKVRMFRQDATEKFYMMNGFALYDKMFSKTYNNFNIYYDINKSGVSFQLLPINKRGFYSYLSFDVANVEQNISDFNDVNTADLKTNSLQFEFGYKTIDFYQFKLLLKRKYRLASQNIYNEESFNNYKHITTYSKFSSENISLGSSHLLDFKSGKSISLNFIYNKNDVRYDSFNLSQNVSNLLSYAKASLFKKDFNLEFSLGYSKCLSSKLNVNTEQMAVNAYEEMLKPNYNYMKADKFILGMTSEYIYHIKNKTSLFARLNCKLENYNDGSWLSSIRLLCGIKF